MSHRSPVTVDLQEFLDREQRIAASALEEASGALLTAVPESLSEPIRYALASGGKRLRPIFCATAYRASAGGATPEALYALAASLEIIHTYSLVHDDLPCMDDDDFRRGQPAVHRAFGVDAAVLAGAAMIPLACAALHRGAAMLDLAPETVAEILRELCGAAGAGGMVGGQLLDLEAEGRSLTLAELETIHRRKTGALIGAAVRIGALAARAADHVVDALESYGLRVGLAFQITDDVLDVTAESAILGKPAGSDHARGKSTFVGLLGVDGARDRAREEIERAVDAIRIADVATPELEALASHAVERDR